MDEHKKSLKGRVGGVKMRETYQIGARNPTHQCRVVRSEEKVGGHVECVRSNLSACFVWFQGLNEKKRKDNDQIREMKDTKCSELFANTKN